MSLFQQFSKILTALVLVLVLTITTACSGTVQAKQPTNSLPVITWNTDYYAQLERGNTRSGQDYGNWVTQTAKGLIQDAYVRDNNKLGVVITPQVRPTEVKTLAKLIAQCFRRNFPNQDLTFLMYRPGKKMIVTANYDT